MVIRYPKKHRTDAIWEQTPTTRAPGLHLQYHEVTEIGLYSIHNIQVQQLNLGTPSEMQFFQNKKKNRNRKNIFDNIFDVHNMV